MQIEILHNKTSSFMPYTTGDTLTSVCTWELDRPAKLDEVFFICNVADDPGFNATDEQRELAKQYRAGGRTRSLSVGDVVRIGDERWACDSFGWRLLEA